MPQHKFKEGNVIRALTDIPDYSVSYGVSVGDRCTVTSVVPNEVDYFFITAPSSPATPRACIRHSDDFELVTSLSTKDQPMIKLSDFLKEQGVYEKFLANLDVNYSIHDYQNFIDSSTIYDAIFYAFSWKTSPEDYGFWADIVDLDDQLCINDVRAPNDIEYWEEQFHLGHDVWVALSGGSIQKCSGLSPKGWTHIEGCYSEQPSKVSPTSSAPHRKFKVGDYVYNFLIDSPDIYEVQSVEPDRYDFGGGRSMPFENEHLFEVTSAPSSEPTPPAPKEPTMPTFDLKLLLQFMEAVSQDAPVTDATNANHIAVLTEADGSYVGYIYGNSIEEFEEIIRRPENESRKFHIFNYDTH